MVKVASRPPVVAATLSFLLAGAMAHADIGFDAAAATARMLNPGRPLIGLRHKINANPAIYACANVNMEGSLIYGLDIHGSTGFIVGSGVEAVLPPEDVMIRDMLDRLPLVNYSFEQALAAARTNTGRPDATLDRIDLVSELFLIFYDLRYFDGTRYMVDAITGEVLPQVDVANSANSVAPYAMFNYITLAEAAAGEGWYPIMTETAVTPDGLAVGVTLLNPSDGRLKQVDRLGKMVQVVEFTPVGHLAQVVTGLRNVVAQTVVDAGQFLARVEHDFPGGRVSAVGLQTQFNNGQLRTQWSASVLTALNQPLEFAIDAMQPIDSSLGISTAPQNIIPGDYNRDGHVTGSDLAELLQMFGEDYPPYDLDHDGFVKGEDLAILLSNWG